MIFREPQSYNFTVLKYLSLTPLNSMYIYRIMETSDQEEWLEK